MQRIGEKVRCSGCNKLYEVEQAFETIAVVIELHHGYTNQSDRLEFCPECQHRIKNLIENLGKKE